MVGNPVQSCSHAANDGPFESIGGTPAKDLVEVLVIDSDPTAAEAIRRLNVAR